MFSGSRVYIYYTGLSIPSWMKFRMKCHWMETSPGAYLPRGNLLLENESERRSMSLSKQAWIIQQTLNNRTQVLKSSRSMVPLMKPLKYFSNQINTFKVWKSLDFYHLHLLLTEVVAVSSWGQGVWASLMCHGTGLVIISSWEVDFCLVKEMSFWMLELPGKIYSLGAW